MSSHDPVDVLIIGAGASGAAIVWSLLETRMRILCLNRVIILLTRIIRRGAMITSWRAMVTFPAIQMRQRKQDYPINSAESCITPVNWNGVGGSTINFLGHWPRLRPSDFRRRHWMVSPKTGRWIITRWHCSTT